MPEIWLAFERAVCLLERLERGDRARTADDPEVAVHLVRGGQLPHIGRVVGRVQRREDPLRDLAAGCAEVSDDPCARRPGEAVVVHDDGRGLPALLVHEVADAGVPLRTVAVVAEEVRRPHLERRVLRARGAVDERLRRMRLRIVRHGDRLVTRQRADQDVRAELLHQALRLLDREVRAVVRAAEADDLQRVPGNRAAGHARGRLVRVHGLGACELREPGDRAADVGLVLSPERALAVRQDADLDRRRGRGLPDRGCRENSREHHRGESAHSDGEPERAASLLDVRHEYPPYGELGQN